MNYRITADSPTDSDVVLARAKTLEAIAARLDRDAAFWCDRGYDGFLVETRHEDGSWSTMLEEDLLGRLKRGEISFPLYKGIRGNCL